MMVVQIYKVDSLSAIRRYLRFGGHGQAPP
jgi:hypothetical protein